MEKTANPPAIWKWHTPRSHVICALISAWWTHGKPWTSYARAMRVTFHRWGLSRSAAGQRWDERDRLNDCDEFLLPLKGTREISTLTSNCIWTMGGNKRLRESSNCLLRFRRSWFRGERCWSMSTLSIHLWNDAKTDTRSLWFGLSFANGATRCVKLSRLRFPIVREDTGRCSLTVCWPRDDDTSPWIIARCWKCVSRVSQRYCACCSKINSAITRADDYRFKIWTKNLIVCLDSVSSDSQT